MIKILLWWWKRLCGTEPETTDQERLKAVLELVGSRAKKHHHTLGICCEIQLFVRRQVDDQKYPLSVRNAWGKVDADLSKVWNAVAEDWNKIPYSS